MPKTKRRLEKQKNDKILEKYMFELYIFSKHESAIIEKRLQNQISLKVKLEFKKKDKWKQYSIRRPEIMSNAYICVNYTYFVPRIEHNMT